MSEALSTVERVGRFARDLVVQAGAGTGKTHALCTLYLHLCAGATARARRVPPERILVVTFTDKAASELRERIARRLGDAAASGEVAVPDEASWRAVVRALPAAPIGTFHSFAQTLLRRYALVAGVDPDFQIIEEADARARISGAADRLVLDALGAGDSVVEELVAQFDFHASGRRLGLVELLVDLRARRAEEGKSGAGLADGYDAAALGRAHADAIARLSALAAELPALVPRIDRKTDSARVAAALCASRFDFARPDHAAAFFRDGAKLRTQATGPWREALKAVKDPYWDTYTAVRAAPLAAAIAALVDQVEAQYRAYKRKAGLVDFADLITLSRDLLRDHPQVRAKVRARFDAVLVDEFQDTNAVQAELVAMLGARQDDEARLFVVGDRKQSIYEFRGADLGVFARATAAVLSAGGDEALLTQSRRSAPSLLAFMNALFARALGSHAAALGYDAARDDLTPFRDEPAAPSGAELIKVARGTSAEMRAREARAIARRIGQLLAGGRRAGEVAILLRRFTHLTDYLDALRSAGLPYYVVRGRGLFAAQEVRDLAAALTVLDDPDNSLALVALLRSPLVGVSDETLVRLSLAEQLRARTLFDATTVFPAEMAPAERAGLERFRARFSSLRRCADRLGPAACVQAILDGSDFIAVLASTVDGEQRVANLQRVLERAQAFEERGGDLRAFANWLGRATAPGGEADAAEAQIADERDDVIRVMTVHQAKGLEFPIVFVPACGANERNDGSPMQYDPNVGLGLKLRDERKPSERIHSTASRRVTDARRARQRAESLRVFYVAATRAKDLLVLSGEPLHSDSWRAHLDAVAADPSTQHLVRVLDGDALPALETATAITTATNANGNENANGHENDDALDVGARFAAVVAPPAPQPSSITVAVTQLAELALCPRRYQQMHVLKLDEHSTSPRPAAAEPREDDDAPSLDPLRRGTLAHRLLERLPFSRDGAARAEIDRLLAADGYDLADEKIAGVKEDVARFLDSGFARGLDGAAVRRELPFLMAVPFAGGVLYLRGQMDLVVLTSDGVTVVDYKHARRGDARDYRFQLDAYALAARRLYPRAPSVRSGLAFLKEGDPTPEIAAAPALEPFEAHLAELGRSLARARAAGAFAKQPLATCHELRCGYVYRCYPGER